MRAREVAREALRDLVSGTTTTSIWIALFVVTVGAVVVAQATSARSAVDAADRWLASGAATLVETAEERIDGRACDALSALPTVQAAGAIRAATVDLSPAALPRGTVPTYDVTPGFAALLPVEGTTDGLGLVVSDEAARALGLTGPGDLATRDGHAPVQGVFGYPDDGRDPALTYSALAASRADGGPFDACWVTSWPASDDVVQALGRTVLPGSGGDTESRPVLGQLNSTLGVSFHSPPMALDGWGAAAAGGLGVASGAASVWRRRSRLASDRHVGVTTAAQLGSQSLQAAVWTTVASLCIVSVVLAVTFGLRPDDSIPISLDAGRTLAVGAVGVLLGVVVAAVSVRESSLLRYVRQR